MRYVANWRKAIDVSHTSPPSYALLNPRFRVVGCIIFSFPSNLRYTSTLLAQFPSCTSAASCSVVHQWTARAHQQTASTQFAVQCGDCHHHRSHTRLLIGRRLNGRLGSSSFFRSRCAPSSGLAMLAPSVVPHSSFFAGFKQGSVQFPSSQNTPCPNKRKKVPVAAGCAVSPSGSLPISCLIPSPQSQTNTPAT
jgi:hypothetical protein